MLAPARARVDRRALSISRGVNLAPIAPILLPLLLLLAGSLVGLPFSLDAALARERVLAIAASGGLAILAFYGLRRLPDRRIAAVLLGFAGLVVAHELWIIAVSGPATFRGPVGEGIQQLFAPLYHRIAVSDHVEVINARYMWGLANLCLVPIFAAVAVWLARPQRGAAIAAGALLLANLALLVGTGQRGAIIGLLAGLGVGVLFTGRWGRWLALAGLPFLAVLAVVGVLPKGLDLSSTQGRLIYWLDLARLLTEFPLTGTGLGLDTANAIARTYQLNPDPERVFYAHNTFVQTYQEQGPLGTLAMLALPLLALAAAVLALRQPVPLSRARQALLFAGVSTLVGLEVHGLTDQVVPSHVGTLLVFLSLAVTLAAAGPAVGRTLAAWTKRLVAAALLISLLVPIGLLLTPAGRAQALLNLGGLQLNRALLARDGEVDRQALAMAEATLAQALAQEPEHPAVWRNIARARLARNDPFGAFEAAERAARSPRADAFDALQIAGIYRDLGFSDQAYELAARAYERWGREPPVAIIRPYQQATLPDDFRVRTLVAQGEAAVGARAYAEALMLFRQALTYAPQSRYLRERVAAAERGVAAGR